MEYGITMPMMRALSRHGVARPLRWAAGLLLLIFIVGCGPPKSKLVEGQRISTGKRYYDNYFDEVVDVSEKVKELDSDLYPLRKPLTDILDVDEIRSVTGAAVGDIVTVAAVETQVDVAGYK